MHLSVRRYLQLLARYLRPQWPKALLLTLLLGTGIGLQLYNPQLLRGFLDAATAGTGGHDLTWQALLFIALALTQQLVTALARYVGEQISWTATNELRADVAGHCLKLDLGFHKARTPGEMVERIDGDVTALSNFFSQMLIDIVGSAVLMAGVLALLFREDWRVGLGLSLFAGVTLLILSRIQVFAVPFWAEQRQVSAELYGYVGEVLSGTEAIRASGAEGHMLRRLLGLIQRWYRANLRSGMSIGLMWTSSVMIFALGNALAFGLGAYLYQAGAMTVGTVYLVFNYTELLRRPIEQIRTQLQDLQKASAAISRVEELLGATSAIADGDGRPLPAGPLSVTLTGLSFAYADDDLPVLQDLDLALPPGQVLGLLGRTGSGKSTLARLLLRFYDPAAGSVALGGVDLRSAKLADVRRRVGFVTQDVQLLAASVRDNLTFFDPTIPSARIAAVLEDLGLGPWLASLPDGLETQLEAGGGGLSAGEAQLLALARVFLSDPGLVILDEASSRLDPATEALLERAMDRLLAGRTGIIIAHRLATVQRADAILILEDGRVLEHGARADLARNADSRFARLLRTGLEEVLA